MTSNQTISYLWLWVLQVTWVFGPWLALTFSLILGFFALKWVSRFAIAIESRSVKQGVSGFLKIVRDNFLYGAIIKTGFFLIVSAVIIGGLIGVGIQGLIGRNVEEIIEVKELSTPDDTAYPLGNVSLDFVLFVALIIGVSIIVVGIKSYLSLSRQAEKRATSLTIQGTRRPILVKLYYDNKKVGIVVLIIGCWFLWGMIMQVFSLVLLVIPLPKVLTNFSFSFATSAIIWILVFFMFALLTVLFWPIASLVWRHLKLQYRYFKENRIVRGLFYIQAVIWGGLIGSLLNLYILNYVGRLLMPSLFK